MSSVFSTLTARTRSRKLAGTKNVGIASGFGKDVFDTSGTVVLAVDGESVTSDAAALGKASVTAEVLGATKGPKIIIQKYKNKTGYKKRQGHRQKYTQVKVTDISL